MMADCAVGEYKYSGSLHCTCILCICPYLYCLVYHNMNLYCVHLRAPVNHLLIAGWPQ